MNRKGITILSFLLFVVFILLFFGLSYLRILRMDVKADPECTECFSFSKTHAGCAIFVDNKLLLVRDKGSKKLGFPAGTHEFGERAFQTAYRETLEETGYIVFIDDFVKEFPNENFRLFKCNIIEDTKKHDNEIMEYKFVSKEELKDIIDNKKDARYLNQLQHIYSVFDKFANNKK